MAEHYSGRDPAGPGMGPEGDDEWEEPSSQRPQTEPASFYISSPDVPIVRSVRSVALPADDRIPCPKCRTPNPSGALFCWQCFARLPSKESGAPTERRAPPQGLMMAPARGTAGTTPGHEPAIQLPEPGLAGARAAGAAVGGPSLLMAPPEVPPQVVQARTVSSRRPAAPPAAAVPAPPSALTPSARGGTLAPAALAGPLGSAPTLDLPSAYPSLDEPPRSWRWWKVGGGATAAVAVAVVLTVVVRTLSPSTISMPETIAGLARLQSPQVQDFESRIRAYGDAHDVTAQGAVYGYPPNSQSFFVVAVRGTPPEGPDQAFREFASGFTPDGADRTSVDMSGLQRSSQDGVEYICAPGQGTLHGSVCEWDDGRVVGYVVAFSRQIQEAMDLSVVVRTAVEP